MPRGDGTGPMGMGPMTGRAAGYCAGHPVPGFMNYPAGPAPSAGMGSGAPPTVPGSVPYRAGFGRGLGRGRGQGR